MKHHSSSFITAARAGAPGRCRPRARMCACTAMQQRGQQCWQVGLAHHCIPRCVIVVGSAQQHKRCVGRSPVLAARQQACAWGWVTARPAAARPPASQPGAEPCSQRRPIRSAACTLTRMDGAHGAAHTRWRSIASAAAQTRRTRTTAGCESSSRQLAVAALAGQVPSYWVDRVGGRELTFGGCRWSEASHKQL